MKRLLLCLVLTLAFLPSANATTLNPTPILPIYNIDLSQNLNADISGLAISHNSVNPLTLLIGTIGNDTNTVITSAGLGGSDGFMVGIRKDGTQVFASRIGSAGDDLFSAVNTLPNGNFLIAGTSETFSNSISQTNESTTLQIINPDSVTVNSTSPTGEMNLLSLYQVNLTGEIVDSQTLLFPGAVFPQSILVGTNSATIYGQTIKNSRVESFSLPYLIGSSLTLKSVKYGAIPPKIKQKQNTTNSRNSWQISNKVKSSPYFPKFHPKRPLTLILDRPVTGKVIGYYLSNPVAFYQLTKSNVMVILTSASNKYSLYVIS